MGKKRVSDAEFERQYVAAVARGNRRANEGARAETAFYDEEDDAIVLEFSTGGTVEIPCELLDELEGAPPEELAEVELSPQGTALHWENLDIDISVIGAVGVVIGPRNLISAMGSAGGRATSESKARAARINGAKGGRPALSGAWAKSAKGGGSSRGSARGSSASTKGSSKG